MSLYQPASMPYRPAVQVHLLGLVDYDACLALQQRLVYEASGRRDGQISLLLCEHANLITVGRLGSRGHLRCAPQELVSRRIEVRWINRGGGCVMHTPGQLAVYPIVPLAARGLSVGEYMHRLQSAVVETLGELGIVAQTHPERHGLWGRSGQLAMFGTAVKHWTAYHGAFINVSPEMQLCRLVQSDPWSGAAAGSLVAERQQPVRMTRVRETLIRRLTAALEGDRYHVYSGHPLWPLCRESNRESPARVG